MLHFAPARRLDNLVFDAADPSRVLAVLDWELSTLGDPLADLAYVCLPYHMPSVRRPWLRLRNCAWGEHRGRLRLCTARCEARPAGAR